MWGLVLLIISYRPSWRLMEINHTIIHVVQNRLSERKAKSFSKSRYADQTYRSDALNADVPVTLYVIYISGHGWLFCSVLTHKCRICLYKRWLSCRCIEPKHYVNWFSYILLDNPQLVYRNRYSTGVLVFMWRLPSDVLRLQQFIMWYPRDNPQHAYQNTCH